MKYPFIANTEEIRKFLEEEGFKPLTFFQGKKYIYASESTWANKDHSWKDYWYSTFDDPKDYPFLEAKKSSISRFKSVIKTLKST